MIPHINWYCFHYNIVGESVERNRFLLWKVKRAQTWCCRSRQTPTYHCIRYSNFDTYLMCTRELTNCISLVKLFCEKNTHCKIIVTNYYPDIIYLQLINNIIAASVLKQNGQYRNMEWIYIARSAINRQQIIKYATHIRLSSPKNYA